MDIQLAKEEIIRRFKKIDNESLIMAIKNLLDNAQKDEMEIRLNESIDRGLAQSDNNEVKPHGEAMANLRKKYVK